MRTRRRRHGRRRTYRPQAEESAMRESFRIHRIFAAATTLWVAGCNVPTPEGDSLALGDDEEVAEATQELGEAACGTVALSAGWSDSRNHRNGGTATYSGAANANARSSFDWGYDNGASCPWQYI